MHVFNIHHTQSTPIRIMIFSFPVCAVSWIEFLRILCIYYDERYYTEI